MEKVNQNISRALRAAFSLPQNRYFLPMLHLALVALLEAFLVIYCGASPLLALPVPFLALVYVFGLRAVAGLNVGYATVRRVSAAHAFFMLLVLATAAVALAVRAGPAAFLTASLCLAGFMYVLLRGMFLGGLQAAGFLAAYLAILLYPLLYRLRALLEPAPLALIALSYAATAAFLVMGERRTVKMIGYPMLDTAKRALEAWMIGYAPGLEEVFEANSAEVEVKTYAVEVDYGGRRDIIVIPPLHPGPFKGVGGYNLPELISQEMRRQGYSSCVVLHSTSNHDMNPASRREALRYVASLRDPPERIPLRGLCAFRREGRFFDVYGICSDGFRLAIADPKVPMDDFPSGFIERVSDAGAAVALVDAHNKLSTEASQVDYEEPLRAALECRGGCSDEALVYIGRLGFRSEEVGGAGVHAVHISDGSEELRLLVVDSNNAVPGAYEEVKRCGYVLLTTDTHFSSTSKNRKGYWAFGERADVKELCKELQGLRAEPRRARLTALVWRGRVRVSHNGMRSIREAVSGSLSYFRYYLVSLLVIYLATFALLR